MNGRTPMHIMMTAAALLMLGGCNMYVIDFENRLPTARSWRQSR